jgi:hypothetical protein
MKRAAVFVSPLVIACVIVIGACGDEEADTQPTTTNDDGGGSSSPESGSTNGDAVSEDLVPDVRCQATQPAAGATTYYLAINEKGASNDACDGKAPSDEGNGHCPFKDFTGSKTRQLLVNVKATRLELRAGTYPIDKNPDNPLTGMIVQGVGTNAAEGLVLTSYKDEVAVIDGANATREAVRVSGSFITIERLTIQNSGGHNIEVRGPASDVTIRCNKIGPSFASDMVKGDGQAERVVLRANDFFQWDSQAIDLTEVHDWTIEDNDFHDPKSVEGTKGAGIGTKKGSRDVLVKNNRFKNSRGVTTGTSGQPHPEDVEAIRLTWDGNTMTNITGPAVKLYSCRDCSFTNNLIDGAAALSLFTDVAREGPSTCTPTPCKPSEGAKITGNKIRKTTGPPAGLFQGMYSTEGARFVSANNLYCTAPSTNAGFFFDAIIDFSAWKMAVKTDETSLLKPDSDPACTSW